MAAFAILAVIAVVALLLLRGRRRESGGAQTAVPRHAIVVDGSNVMHWGQGPSAVVLSRVLRALVAKGYVPIVFFDANVGYLLGDGYLDAGRLSPLIGTPARFIRIVDKGVVADEAILAFATQHGLRVVTNDAYRDWRLRFPIARQKGRLLRGTWRDGSVVWRGKL